MYKKTTFQKTEELLRNYNDYLTAINNNKLAKKTKKLIFILNNALRSIKNDYYYSVIEDIYFEHKTREEIAEQYNVDVRTINRNKNRLVNKLKIIIFSEESIKEIFHERGDKN